MKVFRIQGSVVSLETKVGISGLRVEAWDKDLLLDDLVGSSVTDSAGHFVIQFDETYYKELFLDRSPDLFFKVYKENELLVSTEDSVNWNVSNDLIPVVIEVDAEPSESTAGTTLVTEESILFNLTSEQQVRLKECMQKGSLQITFDSKRLNKLPDFLKNGVLID
jgi:hypothetical protein